MRVLKILGGAVAALVVAVALLFLVARFSDGPMGLIPGGPLAAGELVATPADWAFAAAIDTIEMQLADDSTSRTTWIVVREGSAFIPCSLAFPPGKDWHHRADADGAAILRIDGSRYSVSLDRVQDPALEAELKSIVAAKYDAVPPGDGGTWFFAVTPRST